MATSAVFLDIKSVYDDILPAFLIQKLQSLGFSPRITQFIYNLVFSRQITCSFGAYYDILWTYKGLSQGSVLSPMLYIIYVSDLDTICSPGSKLLQYADDVCIFSSDLSLEIGLRSMERSVNNANTFFQNLGLSLSTTKTQLCIFSRKNKELTIRRTTNAKVTYRRQSKHILIGHDRIYSSPRVTFLGMTFQSDLGWSSHINNLIKRCANSLRTIKCLSHTWWGANPNILQMIYRALIRSRLDYGGFLLNNLFKNLTAKLNKIQYTAIRSFMGYRLSTPLNVVLTDTREAPLNIRNFYLSIGYLSRAALNDLHPILTVLEEMISFSPPPLSSASENMRFFSTPSGNSSSSLHSAYANMLFLTF